MYLNTQSIEKEQLEHALHETFEKEFGRVRHCAYEKQLKKAMENSSVTIEKEQLKRALHETFEKEFERVRHCAYEQQFERVRYGAYEKQLKKAMENSLVTIKNEQLECTRNESLMEIQPTNNVNFFLTAREVILDDPYEIYNNSLTISRSPIPIPNPIDLLKRKS